MFFVFKLCRNHLAFGIKDCPDLNVIHQGKKQKNEIEFGISFTYLKLCRNMACVDVFLYRVLRVQKLVAAGYLFYLTEHKPKGLGKLLIFKRLAFKKKTIKLCYIAGLKHLTIRYIFRPLYSAV